MMSPEGGSPPPGHNHGADMPGMEDTGTARKGASIEISDEDRTEVTALLENAMEAYLSAHDQLARDGDARGAAADFLSTLADPNLPEVLSPLRSAAEALESAEDIELQRERFIPLSRLYIDLIDATGATLNTGAPLGVYHCPMAGDDGADWVQPQGTTQNPYFGTSMSKCGSMTRELGGGQ
ncbi:MAG TPA: DUF3347 domain-containing protein [Planctomycetes bacterium]|nr:DUF3347 domain-containing protein [Planctomycetota bacterium]